MRWLAIDPGETVGWAAGNLYTGQNAKTVIEYGELSREDFDVEKLIREFHIHAVVIERFTPRHRNLKKGSSVAIEVGTETKLKVEQLGIGVHWQSASDAKGVITDERLKKMSLWVAGKPHARDAIRHLVIALRREGVRV